MVAEKANHSRQVWAWEYAAAFLILGIALARVIALGFNPIELYADESQYWVWSLQLDWGYFSKPPMIAWLIRLMTTLFGDSDFSVRLASPLLHTITASFIFLSARRLWDSRTGFWAAAIYLTIPSMWISGAVISTDVPVMCAFSGGLYALLRLRDGGGWASAAGLGLAIGLGFLSKYAMIYFALGLGIVLVIDAPARAALLNLRGALALLIGLALLTPNILWNAAHDFATVTHTAANANWGGDLFHPGELLEFLAGQLGIFGPALFPVLVVILGGVIWRYTQSSPEARLLAAFSLPPLLTVCVEAFISRAHANWASAAYVAGTLLVASFLLRGPAWRRGILYGSIAFHTALGVFMAVTVVNPALVETFRLENSTKRIRAWEETAAAISEAGLAEDFSAIVFDDRNIFHQMQRYGSTADRPLRMWLRYSGPVNHAEQEWPLEDGHPDPVLLVSHRPLEVAKMREDFDLFESAGSLTIALDGDKTREFTLWRAQGYHRIARNDAFETRWQAIDSAIQAGD
tara:strand:+ start:4268 stop:5821 length:1554 start_codon:yes stop_codon:yes gene_type:complete